MTLRTGLFGGSVAFAAGVLIASGAWAQADSPAGKLTGAAAWQRLVGNTVRAKTRAGGYTEFYTADNAVKHLDQDGKASGTWKLEGQKVCFEFPDEDDASCVDIEVEGTTGAFIDADATRDNFEIMPGNAMNL